MEVMNFGIKVRKSLVKYAGLRALFIIYAFAGYNPKVSNEIVLTADPKNKVS